MKSAISYHPSTVNNIRELKTKFFNQRWELGGIHDDLWKRIKEKGSLFTGSAKSCWVKLAVIH